MIQMIKKGVADIEINKFHIEAFEERELLEIWKKLTQFVIFSIINTIGKPPGIVVDCRILISIDYEINVNRLQNRQLS